MDQVTNQSCNARTYPFQDLLPLIVRCTLEVSHEAGEEHKKSGLSRWSTEVNAPNSVQAVGSHGVISLIKIKKSFGCQADVAIGFVLSPSLLPFQLHLRLFQEAAELLHALYNLVHFALR